MHPRSIVHLNNTYDLTHIPHSQTHSFTWIGQNKENYTFNVEVTYTSHFYSEELKSAAPTGAYTFKDRGQDRIFCPIRHAHSLLVPGFVNKLLSTPTTRVMKTTWHRNWLYYQLTMTPPLQPGQRYYVFFSLKQKLRDRTSSDPHWLSMVVESAYAKNHRVGTETRKPFGWLAEHLVQK